MWFKILSRLTSQIAESKKRLLRRGVLGSIISIVYILTLEIILGIISLPLYFSRDHTKEPELFNQEGFAYCTYRLRKRVTLSTIGSVTVFFSIYVVASLVIFLTGPTSEAATITWDGGGGDSNWSTAANWSSDTVPTSTDIAVFDNTSVKDATIDAGFAGTVLGIEINSGYTGTITQSRTLTVNGNFTLGTSTAGTFLGNNEIIDINGTFTERSGTFQASSVTTSISGSFRPTGGLFLHNGGTLVFDGSGVSFINLNSAGLTVSNLTFNKPLPTGPDDISYEEDDPSLIATGTLRLMGGHLSRVAEDSSFRTKIEAQGPVIHGSNNFTGSGGVTVTITGAARTIELLPGASMPRLDITSTGTIVNMNGTVTTSWNGGFILNAGQVNANNATIYNAQSITINGPVSKYVGGPGSIYIDSALICTNGGVADFGSGAIQVGSTFRVASSCVIDMGDASSVIFRQDDGSPMNTFSVGYGGGTPSSTAPTLRLPSTTTTITGDFLAFINGATVNANGGTVVLEGTNQTVSGTVSFASLLKIADTTSTLRFSKDGTITITGTTTLFGNNPGLLQIYSTVTGTPATIIASGATVVGYLDVRDIRNNGTLIDATGQVVIDSGNNLGWTGMIDLIFPTAPGNLTLIDIAPTQATLAFGVTSTDVNFADYRLFYRAGSAVTTTDTAFTSSSDPNLGFANYGSASSTTLQLPTVSTEYTVNIWAYDRYNNATPALSAVTFYTPPNPPSAFGATDVGRDVITLGWNQNSNLDSTAYFIEDLNDGSRNSGWITGTTYTFSGLIPGTEYTFRITARDVNDNDSEAVTSEAIETDSSGLILPPGGGGPGDGGGSGSAPPYTMEINQGAATTSNPNVTLNITASGITELAISNDANFTGASFMPFSAVQSWTLLPGTGTRAVYARLRSTNGATTDIFDTIEVVDDNTTTGGSVAVCGNGIFDPDEDCDDGNAVNGDGCSAICESEAAGSPPPTTVPPAPPSPPPATLPSPTPPSAGGGNSTPPPPPPPSPETPVPPEDDDNEQLPITPDPEAPPITTDNIPVEIIEEPITPPITDQPATTSSVTQVINETPATIVERTQIVFEDIGNTVTEFTDDPTVEKTAKEIVAPVVTVATAAAIVPSLVNTVIPLLRFLFLQPLLFLGIRRKNVWGEVYNSATKLPIDLATVRLIDAHTNRIIQTRVTDSLGRYLFLPIVGTYRVTVQKAGFTFPSTALAGITYDGKRLELYHGGELRHEQDEAPIALTIPLDPVTTTRPITARQGQKYLRGLQQTMAGIGIVTTGAAFVVTPSWQVGGLLVIHIVLTFGFNRYVKPKTPKRSGVIFDQKTRTPISEAIVRLYSKDNDRLIDTQITNPHGQYAFLVGPNDYYLTVERPGYRGTKSNSLSLRNTEQSFITMDIGIEKAVPTSHLKINFLSKENTTGSPAPAVDASRVNINLIGGDEENG